MSMPATPSPSSSRRWTRVTRRCSAGARWRGCCRGCRNSRVSPRRAASVSPSTPKSRTVSNFRSSSSRRCCATPRPATGRDSGSPSRPTGAAPRPSSTISSGSRATCAGRSRCGSSKARTGTARSSARRNAVLQAIRSTRARSRPMSLGSPARGASSPQRRWSIRSSPPTTHTASARSSRCGQRACRWSSNACTAWAACCTTRRNAASPASRRSAPMRRSDRMPTSSPTWCGGCSRTARTPRS